MKEINVNTNIYPNIGWHIGVTEECEIALKQLGITHVSIKTQRGSHTGVFISLMKTKNCLKMRFLVIVLLVHIENFSLEDIQLGMKLQMVLIMYHIK